MEWPLRIVSSRQWLETNERIEKMEHALGLLGHEVDRLETDLDGLGHRSREIRHDIGELRRKFNEKNRKYGNTLAGKMYFTKK